MRADVDVTPVLYIVESADHHQVLGLRTMSVNGLMSKLVAVLPSRAMPPPSMYIRGYVIFTVSQKCL